MTTVGSPPAESAAARPPEPRPVQPLPAHVQTIQPGGGVVMSLEGLWGRLRRWRLKAFRKKYVAAMAAKRRGQDTNPPHEVLDPRDLKYIRNQTDLHWDDRDNPFLRRRELPFARWGFAELLLFSVLFFGSAVGLGWAAAVAEPLWARLVLAGLAVAAIVVGGLVVWFFRNPRRRVPQQPDVLCSPADGKIAEITELADDPFIGGPAVRIGIFLSIFNVHINRAPAASRVVHLDYVPGKFLNALRPESARENERMEIGLEQRGPSPRGLIVRQITGAIARRIVCDLRPGEELEAGQPFGMIKLGSRTELVLPAEDGLVVTCDLGDTVKAGKTVLAEYRHAETDESATAT